MATKAEPTPKKRARVVVLGRSAVTGRAVLAPLVPRRVSVSDERIAEAVKNALEDTK